MTMDEKYLNEKVKYISEITIFVLKKAKYKETALKLALKMTILADIDWMLFTVLVKCFSHINQTNSHNSVRSVNY